MQKIIFHTLTSNRTMHFIISLFIAIFFLSSCSSFKVTNQEYKEQLSSINDKLTFLMDSFENRRYRYVYLHNHDSLPNLILIHGAPSSSGAFIDYLKEEKFNQNFNVFIIDRFGYGFSDYGHPASIKEQAMMVKHLVEKRKLKRTFLLGRSFGGPIAALAAVYLEDKVSGTIMIAPAIDPDNEKYIFGWKLAYWNSTKWIFSKAWQVSAAEKKQHAKQLKEIKKEWKRLKTPILHIHGTKDRLAPFKNLKFSKNNFNEGILSSETIENKGHLVAFTQKKRDLIYAFIENVLIKNKGENI